VQVKAFGMLHLQRAKTDRIDAVLIDACTQVFWAIGPDATGWWLPRSITVTTAVEEVACLRQTLGGRCGRPSTHSSYTTS
jgi:hypothetical protein